jgi:protein-S-isoprenylcysteine O-methyltransferase Ste14
MPALAGGRAGAIAMAEQSTEQKPRSGGVAVSLFVHLPATLAVMAAALFWPAGTFDWPRGWAFLGLYIALMIVAVNWVWRANPELFAVRRKFQKGTKAWDAVVASLTVMLYFMILPVAAFDDARFHWAPQPDWVVWIGYALTILGFAGTTWAQSVNRHFEATVRIQTDRGHKVIDTGPYAFIRHPGYSFAIVMSAGMALSLGSLYALIPVGISVLLLAGRTLGEEAELRKGLEGYVDYARRVRFRWFPGLW